MLVQTLLNLAGALINLCIRILYLPVAILGALQIIIGSWRTLLTLALIGLIGYGVGRVGSQVAAVTINTINKDLAPVWRDTIYPILGGIIQVFFNRAVCIYDGIVYLPYGILRNTVFPILRNGNFGPAVSAFAKFLTGLGGDFFIGYIASGDFLTLPFNWRPSFALWQQFWALYQQLWCYGCVDLCPFYTMVPLPLGPVANQYADPNWGLFLGDSFNGWMIVFQQTIYVVRQIVFPTQPTKPYLDYSAAFGLWCDASTALRLSYETAVQQFWNNFVPYGFSFENFFSVFDALTCVWLQVANLLIELITHGSLVLQHFNNQNSTYWNTTVRLEWMGIINLIGPATYFDPIPLYNSTIVSYQLLTTQQAAPGEYLFYPQSGIQHINRDTICVPHLVYRLMC